MSSFRADLPGLEDFVSRLASFDERATELAEGMDAQVRALGAEWTGRAAEEHHAAHRQWLAGARRLSDALMSLRSVVATAHGNYSSAVEANTSMWG